MVELCPNTGEVCLYRTHLKKIHDLSILNRATEAQGEDGLYAQVTKVFAEAIEASNKSNCDEHYCAALANAVTGSLLSRALFEDKLLKQNSVELSEGESGE